MIQTAEHLICKFTRSIPSPTSVFLRKFYSWI